MGRERIKCKCLSPQYVNMLVITFTPFKEPEGRGNDQETPRVRPPWAGLKEKGKELTRGTPYPLPRKCPWELSI